MTAAPGPASGEAPCSRGIERVTAEQQDADTFLCRLAAPHRFRVVGDPENCPVIPGKLGQIEYHNANQLAVPRLTVPELVAHANALGLVTRAGNPWKGATMQRKLLSRGLPAHQDSPGGDEAPA
jgi:hypothetical protein